MPFSLRRLRCAVLALLLCASFSLPTRAQQANAATLPDTARPASAQLDQILPSLNRGLSIGQIAVSPDGKRLAWFQSGEIRVAPLDDLGESQRVTAASPTQSCTEFDFDWSPDSAALVFLSDCADPGGQMDLYLMRLDGNPAKRLTNLHGFVHDPAFSPDGTKVAFLYVEGATRPATLSRRRIRPPASSARKASRSSALPRSPSLRTGTASPSRRQPATSPWPRESPI